MDRPDGIARFSAVAPAARAVLALVVIGITVALLVGPSQRNGGPDRRQPVVAATPPAQMHATALLGSGDTIDGHPILDDAFIERMQQVATRIPTTVLAGMAKDPRVRYLAQAFTPGDDPGVTEGWFEDPAAALAFGCAVEDDASLACVIADEDREVAVDAGLAADSPGLGGASLSTYGGGLPDDSAPGWRCNRLGVAIGAPVFEPDRCQWPG